MNYLAHALLAQGDRGLELGAFLGDHVRGRLCGERPSAVEAGIALHRAIDTHTDAHPLVRRSRRRLQSPFRRYAGILVDLFYDHLLARRWACYSKLDLQTFATRCYQLLHEHRDDLPPSLKRFAGHLQRHNLLAGYGRRSTIVQVLAGVSSRLSRPNPLAEGWAPLFEQREAFARDFDDYFPRLQHFAAQWRSEQT